MAGVDITIAGNKLLLASSVFYEGYTRVNNWLFRRNWALGIWEGFCYLVYALMGTTAGFPSFLLFVP